jgi:uncharacterized protein (DUF427 family)
MSTRVRDTLMGASRVLRHEPTEKRVRALAGGREVVDTGRALLVWEPRRMVPVYAVPAEELNAELAPAQELGDHATPGESLDIVLDGARLEAAAFRPADPDLADHVLLDHDAFEAWYEEEEPIVGHPRDPFHRIDIRQGSRHVRVELAGTLLAESREPTLLFETGLPVRFYLPRRALVLEPSPGPTRTVCAYKGEASHWSFDVPGGADLAWSYEQPLVDSAQVTGLVAFYDEQVDVTVDGERRERPRTQWTRARAGS